MKYVYSSIMDQRRDYIKDIPMGLSYKQKSVNATYYPVREKHTLSLKNKAKQKL